MRVIDNTDQFYKTNLYINLQSKNLTKVERKTYVITQKMNYR